MKIKANQQLYKGILFAIVIFLIFISSLGYFLGFDINIYSLLIYLLILLAIVLLSLLSYLIIDRTNHKYIVFDNEKIIEKNKCLEKIVLYRHQILYTEYHNSIDFFNGIIDFGYAKIAYKLDSKDNETKYIDLYMPLDIY